MVAENEGDVRFRKQIRHTAQRARYRVGALKHRLLTGSNFPRIAFIHVPKTGGSSISSYFKEYAGSRRGGHLVFFEDFEEENADDFVVAANKAKLATGHMPWNVFTRLMDANTFAFTILRDPYDRIRSLYFYGMNVPLKPEYENRREQIRGMSLGEFLVSSDHIVRAAADNLLARQFAGWPAGRFPETSSERQQLADEAIRNLSKLDLVGFIDEFDSVLCKVAEEAGLPRPSQGYRRNITADLKLPASVQKVASKPLDEEARKLAYPRVEADLMVYEQFRDRGRSVES